MCSLYKGIYITSSARHAVRTMRQPIDCMLSGGVIFTTMQTLLRLLSRRLGIISNVQL